MNHLNSCSRSKIKRYRTSKTPDESSGHALYSDCKASVSVRSRPLAEPFNEELTLSDCSRHVLVVNECALATHDCDSNAECLDLPAGFTCRCRAGFLDVSTGRVRHPGRRCVPGKTALGTKVVKVRVVEGKRCGLQLTTSVWCRRLTTVTSSLFARICRRPIAARAPSASSICPPIPSLSQDAYVLRVS